MIIKNGKFYLEDRIATNPMHNYVEYVDIDNNKIIIPYNLLFGLYDLVKFEKERQGWNFEEYKKQIYED